VRATPTAMLATTVPDFLMIGMKSSTYLPVTDAFSAECH
jgi:hypothetical protein